MSNASYSIFFYFLFVVGMSLVLVGVGMVAGQAWRVEWAKLTSFECGFEPLSSTSNPFSLRFFVVALLFLIFDVEIILLVPLIFSSGTVFLSSCFGVLFFCAVFILILIGGLAHEYNEGSLEWVKDL